MGFDGKAEHARPGSQLHERSEWIRSTSGAARPRARP